MKKKSIHSNGAANFTVSLPFVRSSGKLSSRYARDAEHVSDRTSCLTKEKKGFLLLHRTKAKTGRNPLG
jgi:hypothetical protein